MYKYKSSEMSDNSVQLDSNFKEFSEFLGQCNKMNKSDIISKMIKITDFSNSVIYFEKLNFFGEKDIEQANFNLSVISEFVIRMNGTIKAKDLEKVFLDHFELIDSGAEIYDYKNYSAFINLVLDIVPKKHIENFYETSSKYDSTEVIYTLVHIAVKYREYMEDIGKMLLSSISKYFALCFYETWIESAVYIMKAEKPIDFDYDTAFAAFKMTMNSDSRCENKIKLLITSFDFLNNKDFGLLVKSSFADICSSLTSDTDAASIDDLIVISKLYEEITGHTSKLYSLFTVISDLHESSGIFADQLFNIAKEIKKEDIYDFVLGMYENHEFRCFFTLTPEFNDEDIIKNSILPVSKEYREYQYSCVCKLLKSQLVDKSLTAYILAMLNYDDISLVEYLFDRDPSHFMDNLVRYLICCFDSKKVSLFKEFLAKRNNVRTIKSEKVIDAFAYMTLLVFDFSPAFNDICYFLHYFIECKKGTEFFDFSVVTEYSWKSILDEVDDVPGLRDQLTEKALHLIRKGEQNHAIFLVAIAKETTAIQQAVLAVKDKTELLSSLFSAIIITERDGAFDFLTEQVLNSDNENNKRWFSFLFSHKADVSYQTAMCLSLCKSSKFMDPQYEALNAVHFLLKRKITTYEMDLLLCAIYNLCSKINGYSEFILKYIDLICDKAHLIPPNSFSKPMIVLLSKEKSIHSSTSTKIANTWINYIVRTSHTDSIFEESFIGLYGEMSLTSLVNEIKDRLVEFHPSEFILLSLKRIVLLKLPKHEPIIKLAPELLVHVFGDILEHKISCMALMKIFSVMAPFPQGDSSISPSNSIDVGTPLFRALFGKLSFVEYKKLLIEAFNIALPMKKLKSVSLAFYLYVEKFQHQILSDDFSVVQKFLSLADSSDEFLVFFIEKSLNTLLTSDLRSTTESLIKAADLRIAKPLSAMLSKYNKFGHALLDFLDSSIQSDLTSDSISRICLLLSRLSEQEIVNTEGTRFKFVLIVLISFIFLKRNSYPSSYYKEVATNYCILFQNSFRLSSPTLKTLPDLLGTKDLFDILETFAEECIKLTFSEMNSIVQKLDRLRGTIHHFAYSASLALFLSKLVNSSIKREDLIRDIYISAWKSLSSEKLSNADIQELIHLFSSYTTYEHAKVLDPGTLKIALDSYTKSFEKKPNLEFFPEYLSLVRHLNKSDFNDSAPVIVRYAKAALNHKQEFVRCPGFIDTMLKSQGAMKDSNLIVRDFPQILVELGVMVTENDTLISQNSTNRLKLMFNSSNVLDVYAPLQRLLFNQYKSDEHYVKIIEGLLNNIKENNTMQSIAVCYSAILSCKERSKKISQLTSSFKEMILQKIDDNSDDSSNTLRSYIKNLEK